MDLGADADGAAQAADGDLTGEHAAEDFDDEQRALFVVVPRGDHGFAEGQALDLNRWLDVLEAEAVVLDAVAAVGEFGRDLHGHLLAVAEDLEGCGLASLVLQVGEQGGYGVELEAVDGEDLVLGLETGADGGHVGLKGVDLDGGGLHLGDEAELVEGEVVGAALGFDEDLGVGALAVVEVGEGDRLVDVEQGADGYLVPGGVLDGVVVDDEVAGLDAGGGGLGFGGDVVGLGWAADVLLDLVVEHVDAGHEAEGEDEVGEGAGEGDEDALPAGVGVELAGVAGGGFAGVVACHLDVAAEGEEGDAVVGVAALDAEEALAEADGEGLDADAAELGDGEVAKFVDENHDAKDDGKFEDC